MYSTSLPNLTSYRNLYFTDFVFIPCIVTWTWFVLASDLIEAARGQKHPSDAENGIKESIYLKKFLMKLLSNLKNPITDLIRFELQPQGRKL